VSIIKSDQFIRFRKQSVLILRIMQNTVCRQDAVSLCYNMFTTVLQIVIRIHSHQFHFRVCFLHLNSVKINLRER